MSTQMDFQSKGYRKSAHWGLRVVLVAVILTAVAGVVGFILGFLG